MPGPCGTSDSSAAAAAAATTTKKTPSLKAQIDKKRDDIKKKGGGGASAARPDPWVGSRSVLGLTKYNAPDFLAEKDVALVMYYDPKDAQCEWSKKHLLKAAKTTFRENSAFCAVNCIDQDEYCENEGITKFPIFKLFSKGKLLATYEKPKEFLYQTMKKFVENAPVFEEPAKCTRPCNF